MSRFMNTGSLHVYEEYHLLLHTRAGQTLCLSPVVFWQTVGVSTVPPPRAVGEGGRVIERLSNVCLYIVYSAQASTNQFC